MEGDAIAANLDLGSEAPLSRREKLRLWKMEKEKKKKNEAPRLNASSIRRSIGMKTDKSKCEVAPVKSFSTKSQFSDQSRPMPLRCQSYMESVSHLGNTDANTRASSSETRTQFRVGCMGAENKSQEANTQPWVPYKLERHDFESTRELQWNSGLPFMPHNTENDACGRSRNDRNYREESDGSGTVENLRMRNMSEEYIFSKNKSSNLMNSIRQFDNKFCDRFKKWSEKNQTSSSNIGRSKYQQNQDGLNSRAKLSKTSKAKGPLTYFQSEVSELSNTGVATEAEIAAMNCQSLSRHSENLIDGPQQAYDSVMSEKVGEESIKSAESGVDELVCDTTSKLSKNHNHKEFYVDRVNDENCNNDENVFTHIKDVLNEENVGGNLLYCGTDMAANKSAFMNCAISQQPKASDTDLTKIENNTVADHFDSKTTVCLRNDFGQNDLSNITMDNNSSNHHGSNVCDINSKGMSTDHIKFKVQRNTLLHRKSQKVTSNCIPRHSLSFNVESDKFEQQPKKICKTTPHLASKIVEKNNSENSANHKTSIPVDPFLGLDSIKYLETHGMAKECGNGSNEDFHGAICLLQNSLKTSNETILDSIQRVEECIRVVSRRIDTVEKMSGSILDEVKKHRITEKGNAMTISNIVDEIKALKESNSERSYKTGNLNVTANSSLADKSVFKCNSPGSSERTNQAVNSEPLLKKPNQDAKPTAEIRMPEIEKSKICNRNTNTKVASYSTGEKSISTNTTPNRQMNIFANFPCTPKSSSHIPTSNKVLKRISFPGSSCTPLSTLSDSLNLSDNGTDVPMDFLLHTPNPVSLEFTYHGTPGTDRHKSITNISGIKLGPLNADLKRPVSDTSINVKFKSLNSVDTKDQKKEIDGMTNVPNSTNYASQRLKEQLNRETNLDSKIETATTNQAEIDTDDKMIDKSSVTCAKPPTTQTLNVRPETPSQISIHSLGSHNSTEIESGPNSFGHVHTETGPVENLSHDNCNNQPNYQNSSAINPKTSPKLSAGQESRVSPLCPFSSNLFHMDSTNVIPLKYKMCEKYNSSLTKPTDESKLLPPDTHVNIGTNEPSFLLSELSNDLIKLTTNSKHPNGDRKSLSSSAVSEILEPSLGDVCHDVPQIAHDPAIILSDIMAESADIDSEQFADCAKERVKGEVHKSLLASNFLEFKDSNPKRSSANESLNAEMACSPSNDTGYIKRGEDLEVPSYFACQTMGNSKTSDDSSQHTNQDSQVSEDTPDSLTGPFVSPANNCYPAINGFGVPSCRVLNQSYASYKSAHSRNGVGEES